MNKTFNISFFALTKLIVCIALSLCFQQTAAQVTTSGLDGRVITGTEQAIGATVTLTHEPTGNVFHAVTNEEGEYHLSGLRPGGPYTVTVSYLGHLSKRFDNVRLMVGKRTLLSCELEEDRQQLHEVVVAGHRNSKLHIDHAGATTDIGSAAISQMPTVSRSINDLLRLTPQSVFIGNGIAIGGGNYRQSHISVDGAAFNNAFGIGSNLPGNGSPISFDALDQMTISSSPFDVRLSGFTGGAVNVVTKSGSNQLQGSAYTYTTNIHLKGNKVGDEEMLRNASHSTTWGLTLGGPIIKNKLFFFVNGEYDNNVTAGPSAMARRQESDAWQVSSGNTHRPLASELNALVSFLNERYGYHPGSYQGYSLDTPGHKVFARLDWFINADNSLNIRLSRSRAKASNPPSSSTTPFRDYLIYPGNAAEGLSPGRDLSGRTAKAGMYFESSRFIQVYDYTAATAEWNSRWGGLTNLFRLTYAYQDEPREYVGGTFPTVDILKDGAVWASIGPDPFTAGNLRRAKTWVAVDEVQYAWKNHQLLAGIQYETNKATNGFGAASNGYYVYASADDFYNDRKPAAYGVTFPMRGGGQFLSEMKYNQWSLYVQDVISLSQRFRMTAGLRLEVPVYPSLKNNYNAEFAKIKFRNNDGSEQSYSTDQLPDNQVSLSPRVGFNWDVLGNQQLILRGGTGYFVGRLPFVWLVSAVGNSGCGQFTYYYNKASEAQYGEPRFHPSVGEQLKDLNINTEVTAPSSPTILDKDLKLNAAWKTTLSADIQLPGGIEGTVEALYSREFNPAIVTNLSRYWNDGNYVELSPGDFRRKYAQQGSNAYYLTNGGNKAYYFSLTTALKKSFAFGLDLAASYTYSHGRSYSAGTGDQVSTAYYNDRYSIDGNNDKETGYSTFIAPHRLLLSATFQRDYGKHFGTLVSLIYEGSNQGFCGGNGATRYSYSLTTNVVGDYGSNNLIRIPASREELNNWKFTDYNYTGTDNATHTYTAQQQRDDFWAYILQDDYLKKHKGEYAERGGATMPWHHQLDLKLMQNFYLPVGKNRNTLQLGVDIRNVPNLLNSKWGLYKTVNNSALLKCTPNSDPSQPASFQFQRKGKKTLTSTYSDFTDYSSTYSILFSVRYLFN